MRTMTEDRGLAFRRYLMVAPFAFVAAVVGSVFSRFFLIYGTDTLLVAPAAMGAIMLVTRLFDGASDPVIAWLSDRKAQPRRKPLMLWGTPLFLLIIPLMLPPAGLRGMALVAYLLFFYLLFELGQTLRQVPSAALGFEVARTASRRTLARTAMMVVSMIASILAMVFIQQLMTSEDPRALLEPALLIGTPLGALLYFIGLWRLREVPTPHRSEERPPLKMFAEVLKNRYHRQYIGVQIAESVAYAGIFTSVFYVIRYVIERPEWTFILFLAYTLASILGMGMWWRIVGRLGTRRTWIAGQLTWLATLLLWPTVLAFGAPAYLVLVILAGLASGCGRTVGYAMLGDIADYDARESGRQRQGVYATIYSLIDKIVAALIGFLFGLMLQYVDFVPNQAQGDDFTMAISLSTSILPAIFIFLSIRLLKGFDLYEKEGIPDGREARAVRPKLALG
ncbi:MFS transporter [Sphingomicrobium nitratireducens]|uniref:MFS transporter n=1 Tax=Sphingomicrobium nitratireducens TaxID=2964666 RepID=UPI0022406FBF|nr:MFS transporter [Sphingomicrobium nitratireducens]